MGDTANKNAPGTGAPDTVAAKASGPPVLVLDARNRGLLRRFLSDWALPHRDQIVVALLLTALFAAVTATYPIIIKASFEALESSNGAGKLPYVLTAIIGATALRSLLLYLQTVATNRVVMRMTTDIQKAGFAHLISSDFARLTRETPGRLVSRLTNDVTFIQQAAMAALNSVIRDSMLIIGLVVTMLYLDWLMTLIVLGVYPLAAWPIMVIGKRLRRVAKRTQAQLADMTSLLTEKLSGARLIKTFGLEGYAAERMNDSFERIFSLRIKAVRNRARLDPMLEVLGGLAVAGVIALAYWRIASGISSVGDFMGFITALLMASQPIRGLGSLSSRVQEGLAAVERVYDLLDEKPSIIDRPGARPLKVGSGGIEFKNVGFSYGGNSEEVRAVRNFTLDVPGGSTLALVGRSGAGKSTIINLVPRLFDVSEGRIAIDGQDLRDVGLDSLRANISIVSQEITLFDDTIRANIALGRLGASEADIVAAAKAAAAHDFIAAQPRGYDAEIGDRGMRLSGGQRQRLALARAILKDAPILLLDEATSALDTESERLVQDALAKFTKNRTTLVIAHRLSTVQNADLICVMEDGEMIELGTHADLLAKDGRYALLCRQQFMAVGIES